MFRLYLLLQVPHILHRALPVRICETRITAFSPPAHLSLRDRRLALLGAVVAVNEACMYSTQTNGLKRGEGHDDT